MTDPILAWHFLPADRRLANGDGRLVTPGSRLTVYGSIVLCEHELHASVRAIDALSVRAIDALQYASGPIICRVVVDGVVSGDDQIAGTSRRCLWLVDGTRLLREFACCCARQALALSAYPDPRSFAAIDVAERFARGEATSEELFAASAVASVVASAAAWAATRADAWAAAGAAAWDTAGDAQNTELERRIRAAHRAQCGGEL